MPTENTDVGNAPGGARLAPKARRENRAVRAWEEKKGRVQTECLQDIVEHSLQRSSRRPVPNATEFPHYVREPSGQGTRYIYRFANRARRQADENETISTLEDFLVLFGTEDKT